MSGILFFIFASCDLLRGYGIPTPKSSKIIIIIFFFVLYLKIINISLKKLIYECYSKVSKELKNNIKIKVGQAVLELLVQNQHFGCFGL